VQQNISPATLAGWSLCYQDTYNVAMFNSLTSIQNSCNLPKIMLACKQTGAANYQLLAAAPRVDVFFNQGTTTSPVHNSNGVNWYFSTTYSWGFAPQGAAISRTSCDTAAGVDHLCWHTSSGNGGYRCGNTTGLNASSGWQRFVFQAN
jgi:hypothetical protein